MNVPKSTKLLILITIALTAFAYYTINNNNKKTTFDEKEAQFAVSDSSSIDKIVLNFKQSKLTLQNNGGNWMVENAYKADETKLNQILKLVSKIASVATIPKDDVLKTKENIVNNGIEIIVFNGTEILKKYKFTIDTTPDNFNTLVGLLDESDSPYMLNVPGEDFVFTKLFDKTALNWRDKTLFNSQISSINNVKIQFSANRSDNFEIVKGLTKFEVLGMETKSDSIKILSFLDLFKKVDIKQYLSTNQQIKRDSLLKLKPDFTISLQDRDIRKSNSIKIYYQPKQNGEIYGLVGSKDELVTIRPMIFEYLLQKRSFFVKK